MARKEARIYTEIWNHDRFKVLSHDAQWLYFVKISQVDLSFCGVLTTAPSWWASCAADTSPKQIVKWMEELHTADFVLHDPEAAQVLVCGDVKRSGALDRANLVVAMSRAYAEVRSKNIRQRIVTELGLIYPDGILEALSRQWDVPNKNGEMPQPIVQRMHNDFVRDIRNGIANGIDDANTDDKAGGI